MHKAIAVVLCTLLLAGSSVAPPATAALSPWLVDMTSLEGVLRWINNYRNKPDPASVPAIVQALSRLGAFKDPEQAGAYTGFIAGHPRQSRQSRGHDQQDAAAAGRRPMGGGARRRLFGTSRLAKSVAPRRRPYPRA